MRKTKKIAVLGLLLAIILILTTLEHMLPPLPFMPPNVRLGLSNIVTMYGAFFISPASAVVLTVLKAGFVLLTRGPVAGVLSLSGGIISILVIIIANLVSGGKISYAMISVCGALAHNFGQYAAVSVLIGSPYLAYYLPVLILTGVVMGIVTGTLLKYVMPALKEITRE
ncbi:MAG: Gx transporter family protein [Clostridiales bacterium]|jgi:heptaprenyl diphosphate synthase|nr:Gx transporter family protein [Clostridiales bacterium]